ncbi:MAG: hypothetical protein WBP95_16320, partial [Acidobacteriaceae bacterium]
RAQYAWNKVALFVLFDAAQKQPSFVDNLRIQKLFFISEIKGREENLKTAYYKFFRYNFGPYSKTLANDVRHLEAFGFIDSENRELTERGRFLFRFIQEELAELKSAGNAVELIQHTCEEHRHKTSSRLVDYVYDLRVPVDGLGKEIWTVRDIPMCTDILVPDDSDAHDVGPLPEALVEDIESELQTPPKSLDPASEEFQETMTERLRQALLA